MAELRIQLKGALPPVLKPCPSGQKRCSVCQEPFTPKVEWALYCGVTCRKRAERQRSREKDPKRAQLEHEKTKSFSFYKEFHNPSDEQLDRAAKVVAALGLDGGEMPPVKLAGKWNQEWKSPYPGVVIVPMDGYSIMTWYGESFLDELVTATPATPEDRKRALEQLDKDLDNDTDL